MQTKQQQPSGTDELVMIALDKIVPSKTNPRKTKDAAYIETLASSIAEVGVLQPIVVRAAKQVNTFELVAGECRWTAAGKAGLSHIPAIVKDYDDQQALDAQIIENLHRKDVHPMEESDGYAALVKSGKYGKGDEAVPEIAKRVGQTPEYIGRRLKYQALSAKARKAFLANEILIGHADVLCRLQTDQQDSMIKYHFHGGAPTVGELSRHVSRDIHRQLKTAVFDITDAALVKPAGPCTTCPKRTGATASLFGEDAGDDKCSDPKCFGTKVAAHFDALARRLEKDGSKVVFLDQSYSYVSEKYAGRPLIGSRYFDKSAKETGVKGIVLKLGYSDKTKVGTVYNITVKKEPTNRSSGQSTVDYAYHEKRRAVKKAIGAQYRDKLRAAIEAKLPKKLDLKVLRTFVAARMVDEHECRSAMELLKWTPVPADETRARPVFEKRMQKASESDLIKLLFMVDCSRELATDKRNSYDLEHTKCLTSQSVAANFGIDHEAILKEVKKANPLPERPGKKKPVAKKGKPTKKAKAAKK